MDYLVFGQPKTTQDSIRHLPYDQLIIEAMAEGKITKDDPRLLLNKHDVERLGMTGLQSLQSRAFFKDAKRDLTKTDTQPGINQSLTKMRIASFSPNQNQDHPYGQEGVFAQKIEAAAMGIYRTALSSGDEASKDIALKGLAMAAAAHNLGAKREAMKGFDHFHDSVIQASDKQNRRPEDVARDLAAHGVISRNDPRIDIMGFKPTHAPTLINPTITNADLVYKEQKIMQTYYSAAALSKTSPQADKDAIKQTAQEGLYDIYQAEARRTMMRDNMKRPPREEVPVKKDTQAYHR